MKSLGVRSSRLRKEKELEYKADPHNLGEEGEVWNCSAVADTLAMHVLFHSSSFSSGSEPLLHDSLEFTHIQRHVQTRL